ncbi:hypothetical protein DFH06DRAFT_1118534 [Mycena polygramma]|nr:hypothetical protein DFH06DRAFT_1118534 [Mycena polygramma]
MPPLRSKLDGSTCAGKRSALPDGLRGDAVGAQACGVKRRALRAGTAWGRGRRKPAGLRGEEVRSAGWGGAVTQGLGVLEALGVDFLQLEENPPLGYASERPRRFLFAGRHLRGPPRRESFFFGNLEKTTNGRTAPVGCPPERRRRFLSAGQHSRGPPQRESIFDHWEKNTYSTVEMFPRARWLVFARWTAFAWSPTPVVDFGQLEEKTILTDGLTAPLGARELREATRWTRERAEENYARRSTGEDDEILSKGWHAPDWVLP